MYTALSKLGYHCQHARETFKSNAFDDWAKAVKAKYHGKGRPYGPPEWNRLLGEFDAVTDIPSILFVEELLAAYPTSKIILTHRDPDEWIESVNKTVYVILGWRSWSWLTWLVKEIPNPLDPSLPLNLESYLYIPNQVMHFVTHNNFHSRAALKAGYIRHYDLVRSLVPQDRILEFEANKDGWETLCAFLGKEIPSTAYEYPCVNEASSVVGFHERMWWTAFWLAGRRVGRWVAVSVVIVGGLWGVGIAVTGDALWTTTEAEVYENKVMGGDEAGFSKSGETLSLVNHS